MEAAELDKHLRLELDILRYTLGDETRMLQVTVRVAYGADTYCYTSVVSGMCDRLSIGL